MIELYASSKPRSIKHFQFPAVRMCLICTWLFCFISWCTPLLSRPFPYHLPQPASGDIFIKMDWSVCWGLGWDCLFWTWIVIPSCCWLIAGCLVISQVIAYCEQPGCNNSHKLWYVTTYRCQKQWLLENRDTAGYDRQSFRKTLQGVQGLCLWELMIERWTGRMTSFVTWPFCFNRVNLVSPAML